ncbi:hypothetical protein [Aerolutibacter ruishenii]|uniref:Uncharacterized protein n=1 Tax=Aerolutibacter ruishenii TaxID=686800 RepID=A0A562LRL8_9GAMM|nr:hypothetical protein [Lysobacter ruishenii]TWI10275.1 hypothetical protein IP93_01853 [Lysobacter ruishenii]
MARAWCLAAALAVAPLAQADECVVDLGRGWPPGAQNHGEAAEKLLFGGRQPALALTWLPARGAERSLQIVPADDGDWTLRYAVADERVLQWVGVRGGVEQRLVLEQAPDVLEAPIPAVLGRRLADDWAQALASVVPEQRSATFHEGDLWLLQAGGVRTSGLAPDCGPTERLLEQVDLLIEAVDEKAAKRGKRWARIEQSLDTMREELAATEGAGEGVVNANH